MAPGYHLTRRFSSLYGAAGVWAIAGGGLLTLATGATLIGYLLMGFAAVLLVLIVTGKILKERNYTQSDILIMFLPLIGIVLMALVYFAVFQSSYLVLAYLAIFILLSILAIAEARKSVTSQND